MVGGEKHDSVWFDETGKMVDPYLANPTEMLSGMETLTSELRCRQFHQAQGDDIYYIEANLDKDGQLVHLRIWDHRSGKLLHEWPPTSFSSPIDLERERAALEYLGMTLTEGGCLVEEEDMEQVRKEDVGRVTDYQFVDWEVAQEVQAASKEIDQAVAAARILLGQLTRKKHEIWRGMEDLAGGIDSAARQFASAAEEFSGKE